MSRRKKSRTDGGFVMVSRQMTRSAAFPSLSPRAGWLLVGLMDRYDGNDNRVPMSLREAATWLKTGLHQAAEAFAELEAKGFVRCHQRGGFTRKVRHATVWTLTMFGRSGQKATLDFLNWCPPSQDSDSKTRLPARHQHGSQNGINEGAIDAAPASVSPIVGCQDGINTVAAPASLIECTIESRAPKQAQTPRALTRANGGAGRFSLPVAIKAGRLHRRWSQRDLAHHAQTHQPIVSQIERGDLRKVGAATIERVALAVGLGPRERIAAALRSITSSPRVAVVGDPALLGARGPSAGCKRTRGTCS
jgi:hypothetical protein